VRRGLRVKCGGVPAGETHGGDRVRRDDAHDGGLAASNCPGDPGAECILVRSNAYVSVTYVLGKLVRVMKRANPQRSRHRALGPTCCRRNLAVPASKARLWPDEALVSRGANHLRDDPGCSWRRATRDTRARECSDHPPSHHAGHPQVRDDCADLMRRTAGRISSEHFAVRRQPARAAVPRDRTGPDVRASRGTIRGKRVPRPGHEVGLPLRHRLQSGLMDQQKVMNRPPRLTSFSAPEGEPHAPHSRRPGGHWMPQAPT
jgi:hypothetical protein